MLLVFQPPIQLLRLRRPPHLTQLRALAAAAAVATTIAAPAFSAAPDRPRPLPQPALVVEPRQQKPLLMQQNPLRQRRRRCGALASRLCCWRPVGNWGNPLIYAVAGSNRQMPIAAKEGEGEEASYRRLSLRCCGPRTPQECASGVA